MSLQTISKAAAWVFLSIPAAIVLSLAAMLLNYGFGVDMRWAIDPLGFLFIGGFGLGFALMLLRGCVEVITSIGN